MAYEINIKIDPQRIKEFPLTLDDYIDIQDGNIRSVRELMARFVVDKNDEYVPVDVGRKIVGKIPLDENFGAIMDDFQKKIKDSIVPPTNATA